MAIHNTRDCRKVKTVRAKYPIRLSDKMKTFLPAACILHQPSLSLFLSFSKRVLPPPGSEAKSKFSKSQFILHRFRNGGQQIQDTPVFGFNQMYL